MNYFKASPETIIIRFYLMMAVVIGAFVIGVPVLAALALPIFLSAMMGITFGGNKKKVAKTTKTNKELIELGTHSQAA